jgi:hypothetical protein
MPSNTLSPRLALWRSAWIRMVSSPCATSTTAIAAIVSENSAPAHDLHEPPFQRFERRSRVNAGHMKAIWRLNLRLSTRTCSRWQRKGGADDDRAFYAWNKCRPVPPLMGRDAVGLVADLVARPRKVGPAAFTGLPGRRSSQAGRPPGHRRRKEPDPSTPSPPARSYGLATRNWIRRTVFDPSVP